MLTDVAERLAEYKMFYPDATITRVGFEDCNSISHEDGSEAERTGMPHDT